MHAAASQAKEKKPMLFVDAWIHRHKSHEKYPLCTYYRTCHEGTEVAQARVEHFKTYAKHNALHRNGEPLDRRKVLMRAGFRQLNILLRRSATDKAKPREIVIEYLAAVDFSHAVYFETNIAKQIYVIFVKEKEGGVV